PALVRHHLRRFNRELKRDVRDVPPETADLLARHPWPGNVRELQSVLKQALLRATGHVLLPAFLPESLATASPTSTATGESWSVEEFVRHQLRGSGKDVYD